MSFAAGSFGSLMCVARFKHTLFFTLTNESYGKGVVESDIGVEDFVSDDNEWRN
jgi:hypothetical protein